MSARWHRKLDALAALLRLKDEETKRPAALRPSGMLFGASNGAQSEFLKVASHELRTSLSLIIGHAGLLQDGLLGEVSEEQKKSLAQILKSSNELLALVVSILQAGSIEVDSVELKSEAVPLGCLLGELKAETNVANEKAIELVWDYPDDLPIVATDGEKLKHILRNLIENAVKFTEQGEVRIFSRFWPERDRVEFSVSDTGVGISRETLPALFEKFKRMNGSLTRSNGGLELGLFIARKFIELLGGEITVRSELGKGSTFSVLIPAAAAGALSVLSDAGARPVESNPFVTAALNV